MTRSKVIEFTADGGRKIRSGTYLSDTDLKDIADRIRVRMRRTTKDIIETGADLIQVKAALDHGQFTDWIDAEFDMTDRTAQRYMQAAHWAEDKTDIVSDLPPRTLYLLAAPSTPEDIQKEAVEDLEAGQRLDHGKLEKEIRTARGKVDIDVDKKSKAPEQKDAITETYKRDLAERDREIEDSRTRIRAAAKILLKLGADDLACISDLLPAPHSSPQWILYEAYIRAAQIADGIMDVGDD